MGAQHKPAAPAASITIAQIIDTSHGQQDVSKDFVIGSRAAWQDINAHGGIKGRPVTHMSLEVDGSAQSIRTALATVKNTPNCVALSGTAGDIAAAVIAQALRPEGLEIAHAAPWLQNSVLGIDEFTFPIFAGRQEQISHAVKWLTVMGVHELGVVFGSEAEEQQHRDELAQVAKQLKMQLHAFQGAGNLAGLGQRLTPGTPAILLFVGGTPELMQFTQGLEKQQRQRYVMALADVSLQTLIQMAPGRATPIIQTQPVPLVTSSVPIVRSYRETLSRLFDEPPAALSLAGFIAARYTYEVLAGVEGPLTRQGALAAFQQRRAVDLGGFHVKYDERRRSATFVTQSLLTQDGRIIG